MVRGCVLEPADTASGDGAAAGGDANGRGAAALRLSLRASNDGAVAGRSDQPSTPGAGGTPRQPDVGDKVREAHASRSLMHCCEQLPICLLLSSLLCPHRLLPISQLCQVQVRLCLALPKLPAAHQRKVLIAGARLCVGRQQGGRFCGAAGRRHRAREAVAPGGWLC